MFNFTYNHFNKKIISMYGRQLTFSEEQLHVGPLMSGPYVIYFITRFLSVKFYETCSVHPLSKVMIIVQTLPQSTGLAIS